MAAKELTDTLGKEIVKVAGRQGSEDLGRLVGRILGALCRTGSGGDTYGPPSNDSRAEPL